MNQPIHKDGFEEACNLLREFITAWEEECQSDPYRDTKFFDLIDDDFHALYDKVLGFLRSPRSRIPKPLSTKPPPCPL